MSSTSVVSSFNRHGCTAEPESAGWTACADLIDIHPISGQPLPRSVWWIIETKE
ncbi:TPA: hypothetical protein L3665_006673 [Pseudomonas aeruginosa]|uniref:hypothetical protein n=1 Tax=Gammaproteobacteria TaxID=1236 RepID=UPI0012987C7E|nr:MULTISPECIES: hypothetical protein [Gammaproteobacteria]EIY2605994.1 hypothetical protein [Pseudomonas aeruginosa]EIY2737667.1 hypothetical protein [Pseudomonas aeruginosa]EJM8447345.1 hypothetical protein [Pseudomonas aeruginosa]EKM0196544.1 hypothetical protein [Pseudomonas aeruginosa]EKU2849486.1 hypothetical protein [Pseudomonas aeruginosa]